jgi:hypothetical protein
MPSIHQLFCETCGAWLFNHELEEHLDNNIDHVVCEKIRHTSEGQQFSSVSINTDPPPDAKNTTSANLEWSSYIPEETQAMGESKKISMSQDLVPGLYEVKLSFNFSTNTNKTNFVGKLVLNENIILWQINEHPNLSGKSEKMSRTINVPFAVTEKGINTIDFYYSAADSGKIAYISNTYMKIKRI